MVVWDFSPNEIAKDLETRMDRLFCKKPLMAAAAQSASGDDVFVQLQNRFDLFFHQMGLLQSWRSQKVMAVKKIMLVTKSHGSEKK